MNGPLAQIVALACHANAAFRDGVAPLFFPLNSTCRFCDRVSFGRSRRRFSFLPAGRSIESPDDWMNTLAQGGAIGARLHWRPSTCGRTSDRMTAGLVGGGDSWRLETFTAARESLFRIASWHVWNQQAADQKIWRVHYGPAEAGPTHRGDPIDANGVTERLRGSLVEMRDFSRAHQSCEPFVASFDRALESLTSGRRSGYHQDLAPPGILSEAEARILDRCQSAYVFGAMGSWNNMGFEQPVQAEYERISDRAFESINAAIVSAVNGWAARP
jgi:hypothetical protein